MPRSHQIDESPSSPPGPCANLAPQSGSRAPAASGGNAMEMHEIRYFLAVCETLNFTRAAERVNVTQPALTRAIQKIEEELGGQLFRRERNRTHLTDLGQLIRPQLEEVLKRSEAVKSAARGFLKLDNAPLKLGVMCTIGPLRFMSFLS